MSKTIDWALDHSSALTWTAISGFAVWGMIGERMLTSWNASHAGCVAVAGIAGVLGFRVGVYLVRHFELAEAQSELEDSEAKLSRLKADYEGRREREAKTYAKRLADKDEELRIERERSAELDARWDELQSEERRKREVFDRLNDREKWCIANVLHTSPKIYAVHGPLLEPCLVLLEDVGIVRFQGDVVIDNGSSARSYTISLEWRGWIAEHADELPDWRPPMPT